MALIKCPDCGKEFSEYAECCPECGCPVDAAKENNIVAKPQEETIQSIREVSSPPQQPIEYNQVERPAEQKPRKNRVLYVILGIVLLCAIGIGGYFLCCTEGGLLNKYSITNADTLEITTTPTNKKVYRAVDNMYNCFIVVSKRNLSLKVYESLNNDTALIAVYPVCLGTNRGSKQQEGDKKTPETTMEKPFFITQIQNSSSWRHDFEDGRGPVASYGDWFARLATGFNGIGIYGSYYFESDVPGRTSTGSVVLKPNDFAHLKEHYLFEGMKVVVKKENQGLLPFEITAYQK